ncbi:MAG: VCBS repeat-containing protein, partial [Planctomycetes bacterium]|nr:VCBS repeat-containing protein [Planctomycetota bacterium]
MAALLAVAALTLPSSCGAGLVTGIAAGNGSSSTPESRPPELSLVAILPLVPAENTSRVVVVANAKIAPGARLRVRIEAAGEGVDQLQPTAAGQGGSTSITFVVETGPIRTAVGRNDQDVAGTLSVIVDDVSIASAAIVLARQPAAALDLAPGESLFVSPFGQRVGVLVDGLRSTEAAGVQLFVRTADPSRPALVGEEPPTVTRLCTELQLSPGPIAGVQEVSAVVPGNTFPVAAELFVRDALAGESTVAVGAYYRPDVALVLPSQGPTTGGSLVTLVGNALAPYDFTVTGVLPPLQFDAVSLSFAKGGRVVDLDPQDFRTSESSRDRLVFTMPASPDGRPGVVDVVLRVDLGGATAQVTVSKFLYANPQPFFGPRGTTLERLPVAVSPIALDDAPGVDDAPDFAALYDEGGVAFLQLLLAQENGMFTRFGAPRQIANHEVAAELGPRDLCTGDFDGDHVPDMFLVNFGAATAVHHLVLGQAKPAPPLGAVHRFVANAGTWRCRAADFDGDGLTDVLLVPGVGAPTGLQPEVWLSRPLGVGQPAFAPPVVVPVRTFAYEAIDL